MRLLTLSDVIPENLGVSLPANPKGRFETRYRRKLTQGETNMYLRLGPSATESAGIPIRNPVKISILVTTFNRRNITIRGLQSLERQNCRNSVEIQAFLVDAGSTDGTRSAVQEHFEWVRVKEVKPDIYWNTGMRLAFEWASNELFDYLIWFNDDVVLFDTALQTLLDTEQSVTTNDSPGVIVVGSFQDGDTHAHTYGGFRRCSAWNRTRFESMPPDEVNPKRVDTFNGNFVLISRHVANTVGNLDQHFTHRRGDQDYGLRARDQGIYSWICAGYQGTCRRNHSIDYWRSPDGSLRTMWSRATGPKLLAPKEHWVYLRRHAGILAPWLFLKPYLRGIQVSARIVASNVLKWSAKR